jgi:tetratricopeptide (TPR) repeat protein
MASHVFLSHSTADKPAVEALAHRLANEGIQTWLDKWNLVPGEPWQPAIEEALADSETCAIVIGPSGLSPWQTEEMRVAINRRVTDTQQRFRVIPVLLPGAKRDSLPALLVAGTWVEFRDSIDEPDAFHRLVCGIRGVAPGPGGPDAPGSPRTLHNLPFAPNPAFTGREAELERLGEHLQKRGGVALTQTVALHGLGGVGKTQLAVQYAWKHLGGYEAVLWLRADSPEALDANLAALAGVLSLPEVSAKEQNIQTTAVLGWLKGHERWLLIADNADTEEAVKAVRDRLVPNPSGHVLVTSRLGRWPINMVHLPLELLPPKDATHYFQDRVAKEGHHAGDETAARKLAEELGFLPLALEQAASYILELRWSFDNYRERFHGARPKLLSYQAEGGTRYPASVAKTWSITLERLGPLARALLRLAAWFAPNGIPRGIFLANPTIFLEALGESIDASDLAIEEALSELARFSLIRLTSETVSVHRLLQVVEQDALTKEEYPRWLEWAVRLFNAFAPKEPDDVRTWGIWLPLRSHAETLLEHTQSRGVDAPPTALMINQFGMFLYARADYAQAESLIRRALVIIEKDLGPDHPNVAKVLGNLAQLLQATSRLSEAEPLIRRALAIVEGGLGPDHPDVATGLNNLAGLLQDADRPLQAEPLIRRALVIDERGSASDHPSIARDLNNLAGLLQATGRLSEAEPLYRRALAIEEKGLGLDHPNVGRVLNNLAQLLQDTNRPLEAELFYQRALAIDEKGLGPDHPRVARDLNNLAGLLRDTNRPSQAESLYRRALTILHHFTVATGHEHSHLRLAITNYITLLEEMGRSPTQIRAQLEEIVRPLGMRVGSPEQAQ